MSVLGEIAVDALELALTEVIVAQYEGEFDEEGGEYTGQATAKFDNECTYEGTFEKGMFQGKGKYTWPDSVIYEGDFQRNALTGKGTYTYVDGSIYFGELLDGKRHGTGKLTTSGGQTYEGEWRHGKRHGKGKMVYNTEQTIHYTGEWASNNREGYGIMHYPSGNTYEGEWKHDRKEGYGTMIWKSLDEIYTGHWSQDLPHGFGEHIWGESTIKTVKRQHCNLYRGDFVQGQRHGQGAFFYANGSQYCGQWQNNAKHGLGVFLHTDNRITVGRYEANRMVEGLDSQNLQSSRDSGDIASQCYLNILDILTTYPNLPSTIPPSNSPLSSAKESTEAGALLAQDTLLLQRKQYIRELERLLLKYNQYLKNTYKHYMEETNRCRQRTISVLPPRSYYRSDKHYAIARAAIQARNISKRFFCMSLESMWQCLREWQVIDASFSVEDVRSVWLRMKANRQRVIRLLYRDLLLLPYASPVPPSSSSPTPSTKPSSPLPPPPQGSSTGGSKAPSRSGGERAAASSGAGGHGAVEAAPESSSLSEEPQRPVCPWTMATLRQAVDAAGLHACDLLDAYLDPRGQDGDYSALGHQPLLEHEFVELLVRVVAEAASRQGHVNVDLYQILSKLFHQKMLPLLSEGGTLLSPFLQQFYVDAVQDLVRNRPLALPATRLPANEAAAATALSPNSPTTSTPAPIKRNPSKLASAATAAASTTSPSQAEVCRAAEAVQCHRLEDIWLSLRHQSSPPLPPRPHRTSVWVQGGAIAGEDLRDYLLQQRGMILSSQMTATELRRVVFGEDKEDDRVWERRFSYDDFVWAWCKVLLSDWWTAGLPQPEPATTETISGQGEEETKEKEAANVVRADPPPLSLGLPSSTVISLLQERLALFLQR